MRMTIGNVLENREECRCTVSVSYTHLDLYKRQDTGSAEVTEEQLKQAQKELVQTAVAPFHDPDVRDYIENVRRSHDQIIDNVNIDSVVFAGFDAKQEENADRIIATFHEFIEENKDEILACLLYTSCKRGSCGELRRSGRRSCRGRVRSRKNSRIIRGSFSGERIGNCSGLWRTI